MLLAKRLLGTVDGSEIRRSPVEVGSLSYYLHGVLHPKGVQDFFHQQYQKMAGYLLLVICSLYGKSIISKVASKQHGSI